MATRDVVSTDMGGYVIHQWNDLDSGDDGKPVAVGPATAMSIQIIGGTNVDIQGSNDGGTTWGAMSEPDGTALTDAVPGFYNVAVPALLIRPSGVTGSNMKIVLVAAY